MFRLIFGMTAVLLLVPATAEAHWFRSWYGPRTVTAYYYPAPVYYAPAARVIAYPCPVPIAPPVTVPVRPATPAPPLATPEPAPPSPPPAPPAPPPPAPERPSPEVGERRYYDAYAAGKGGYPRPANGRYSVGFWNLSEQDIILLVGGQRLSVPRGRNVTVKLERDFVWQIEGRPAFADRVPANESAMEIVIRR